MSLIRWDPSDDLASLRESMGKLFDELFTHPPARGRQRAKRQAILNPENTVYSIKRFMGRRVAEVETERKMVPYRVEEGANGMATVRLPPPGKTVTPEEISAMIPQK